MKEILALLKFDPKTQEGITNITIWLAVLVYFIFLNIFIVPITVPTDPANYTLYLFVLFVPAATKLVFFSGDPIAFRRNREAKFFQAQFPDSYIATKYNISIPLARHLWFRCVDRRKDEEEIKRTFEIGFTCRLIYSIRRLTIAFFILSCAFVVIGAVWHYHQRFRGWAGMLAVFASTLAVWNIKAKIFYMAHVFAIPAYLAFANRADENKPTGVWGRWKDINDRNKAWLDRFPSLSEFEAYADGGEFPTTSHPPSSAPPKDARWTTQLSNALKRLLKSAPSKHAQRP